jgi:23S rRNA (uridine2552-2'-O)-methyltransferase
MSKSRRGSSPRSRELTVRVKTAKGRKSSSTRWLQRQLNDPYVVEAKKAGYRSRAAWKLTQLDDRFHFLLPGCQVVDLGAAPGGWTQVAVERVQALGGDGSDAVAGRVIAADILEIDPIEGAEHLTLDLLELEAVDRLRGHVGRSVDVVLSDMAASTIGHRSTDHLRTIVLCEAAADFAFDVLAPEGVFVAKVFQGGADGDLLKSLKHRFKQVRHVKPAASRDGSPETYLVATGFKPDSK